MTKNLRKRGLITGGVAAVLVAGMATGGALVTQKSTIFDNILGTTAEPSTDFKSELVADGKTFNYKFDGALPGESTVEYFDLKNVATDEDGEGENLAVSLAVKPHAQDPKIKSFFDKLTVRINDGSEWKSVGTLGSLINAAPGTALTTVDAKQTKNVAMEISHPAADGLPGVDRDFEAKFDLLFDAAHTN